MTRETKAGLVVSCSFLCLVGVVLYCKLTGKNPSLAEAGSEGGSVSAPADPTPIEENTPAVKGASTLAAGSENSGPGLDSENPAVASLERGLKPSTTSPDGFSIPTPTSNVGGDGSEVSSLSPTNNSTTESPGKTGTHQQGTKTASTQGGSTYFIPDSPGDEKNSGSNSTGADNKDRSTNDGKVGATLDPLADLKEAYKDTKNNASSKDATDASKSPAVQSDDSGKDNVK